MTEGRTEVEAFVEKYGDEEIEVCSDCERACCWQGELMCDEAIGASTKTITVREAMKLGLEHFDYWQKDIDNQTKEEDMTRGRTEAEARDENQAGRATTDEKVENLAQVIAGGQPTPEVLARLEYIRRANELRETLAWLEHDRWSRWMKWMFANLNEENLKRWARQMHTPYEELTEREKDSDRKEADATINAIRAHGFEPVREDDRDRRAQEEARRERRPHDPHMLERHSHDPMKAPEHSKPVQSGH